MTTTKIDVLGIGNAIVDVLSRCDDAFLATNELGKGSMSLIDEAQAESLYKKMGQGVEISGGSAANTIAGIASFGGKGAFIGKVRDDQLGEIFAHDIRSIGVDFTTPAATSGPQTARCLVLVTPDGERTMNTFLGASQNLSATDIDENQVASAHTLYLEGYLWDPEQAKQAFLKGAKFAHNANREVALTLSDAFCVDRYRNEFRKLLVDDVDILFANEAEITSLFQVSNFEDAMKLAAQECKLAVLTRSEKGCVILKGAERFDVPARKIDVVEDTTGAGDLFAAGFLYGYTQKKSLAECGHLGALAAHEVISHIGARPEVSLAELAASNSL